MESMQDITYGVFKAEIKNRFLCVVDVNGVDTICYIPSSCRLSNFIKLEGKTVLLKPVAAVNARTQYSVYAVKLGRSIVILNLSLANRIIEQQIHRRLFSFLGRRSTISREHTVDDYKTDLYIADTRTIIEIKGLLSFDPKAIFPTVVSDRAVKQLKSMSLLMNQGFKVCYVIVSFNSSVSSVEINRNERSFYHAFQDCVSMGMLCKAYSIRIKNGMPIISKQIPVVFDCE